MKIKYTTKKITLLDNFFAGKCNIKFTSLEDFKQMHGYLGSIGVNYIVGGMTQERFSVDRYLGYLSDDTIHENVKKGKAGFSSETLIKENRRLITVVTINNGCGWSQDIKDRPLVLATDILKEIYEDKVETK